MSSSSPIKPSFPPGAPLTAQPEPAPIQAVIDALGLQTHIEGGYFVETDRDPALVPSPFPEENRAAAGTVAGGLVPTRPGYRPGLRNASTSIFYLLTPRSPQGHFHRNRARTVHTLHRGRGRYVLIHADEGEDGQEKRVESFIVGPDVAAGERLQWVVEGGKYKASFLLPDGKGEGEGTSEGLLISETVVPGFEYADHDFLTPRGLRDLLGEDKAKELEWLVRHDA